mgnify:CR=1 FL=1|tara:strand:+ start:5055 stop:5858 length:804 start_codon:yes stop_codon:yes gene_type:complete
MKKIVFLEMSPVGPNNLHKKLFENNDLCDFFYVTFKKEIKNDTNCLGFFPNTVWGETRQKLYELVPKNYDYYCFMDDDIIFESTTNENFIQQLLIDLKKTNSIVLTPYYQNEKGQSIYPTFSKGSYFLRYFTNACCKVYHKDYLDYFFPINLKFGGTYDSALFLGLLELLFMNKIICSHNIISINPPDSRGDYKNSNRDAENAFLMWRNEFKQEQFKNNNFEYLRNAFLSLYKSPIKEEKLNEKLKTNLELFNENSMFIIRYNNLNK